MPTNAGPIDLIQFQFVRDVRDALLGGNDLLITSHREADIDQLLLTSLDF